MEQKPVLLETCRYPQLDHGYVHYVDHMGDDNTVLEDARMSTDKPTGVDVKQDDRLRERLWGDQHTTPFQGCELKVELQLPLFCLRQLDRHRTIKYAEETHTIETIETVDETMREFTTRNEFSGRYSTMLDLFYIPPAARVRRKGTTNKQGSGEPLDEGAQKLWANNWAAEAQHDRRLYEEAVATGMASELARVHLPLNQYTKVRLKGDLLNWLKFLNLRLRPDVQEETRGYARAIGKIVKTIWPKTWAIYEEHTLYGVRLSRTERQQFRRLLNDTVVVQLLRDQVAGADKLIGKLTDGPDLLETP